MKDLTSTQEFLFALKASALYGIILIGADAIVGYLEFKHLVIVTLIHLVAASIIWKDIIFPSRVS